MKSCECCNKAKARKHESICENPEPPCEEKPPSLGECDAEVTSNNSEEDATSAVIEEEIVEEKVISQKAAKPTCMAMFSKKAKAPTDSPSVSSNESECTVTALDITKEQSQEALPAVTPRRHGSVCAFEVSILEKHTAGCPRKKVDKGGRNELEDKVGSYDVINRFVYEACRCEGDIKNSVKSFKLNDPESFGKPLAEDRSKVDVTPVLPTSCGCGSKGAVDTVTVECRKSESGHWLCTEVEEPEPPIPVQVIETKLFESVTEFLAEIEEPEPPLLVEVIEVVPPPVHVTELRENDDVKKKHSVGDSFVDHECTCMKRILSLEKVMNDAKDEVISVFQSQINEVLRGGKNAASGQCSSRGTMVNIKTEVVVSEANVCKNTCEAQATESQIDQSSKEKKKDKKKGCFNSNNSDGCTVT